MNQSKSLYVAVGLLLVVSFTLLYTVITDGSFRIGNNRAQVANPITVSFINTPYRAPEKTFLQITASVQLPTTGQYGIRKVIINWGDGTGPTSYYSEDLQSPNTSATNPVYSFSHMYQNAGTYLINGTFEDQNGSPINANATATIGQTTGPSAVFNNASYAGKVNQPITFSGTIARTGTSNRITSYTFNYGDGSSQTSKVSNPSTLNAAGSHIYTTAGQYTVTLAATDVRGATTNPPASAQVNVSPDIQFCALTANPSQVSVDSQARSGSTVLMPAGDGNCSWSATSSSPWLTITSPTSGIGQSTLTYQVAANTGNSRVGTITANNANFTVNQAAPTVTQAGAWAKKFGSTGSDSGTTLFIDSAGNHIVSGYFEGTVDFSGTGQPGATLTSAGGLDLFIAKYNSSGSLMWAKRYGSTGTENSIAMNVDSSGNILVGGHIIGTANLGGNNLVSNGQQDAFLAKYNSSGEHQWSTSFGGTLSDQVNSISTDSAGNVAITGWYQSQLSPMPITGTNGSSVSIQSRGQADTYIAKFNSAGTISWAKSFLNGSWDQGSGVAFDQSGNIYIAGFFQGWINFGGGQRNVPSGYIAKFNGNGDYLWDSEFGYSNGARVYAMKMDNNGDIIVAGDFHGQTNLGGGTIVGTSLDVDFYVAKYSGVDGTYRWARPILGNGSYGGDPTSVTVDAQNNVYVTGYFRGTYNFGNTSLTGGGLWLSYDGFLAKYTSAGAPIHAQTFGGNGGNGSDQGNAVAIDPAGKPVVTGYFANTASFDGSSLSGGGTHDPNLTLTSSGIIDGFLVKFAQ